MCTAASGSENVTRISNYYIFAIDGNINRNDFVYEKIPENWYKYSILHSVKCTKRGRKISISFNTFKM